MGRSVCVSVSVQSGHAEPLMCYNDMHCFFNSMPPIKKFVYNKFSCYEDHKRQLTRKLVLGVSEKVSQKPACTVTVDLYLPYTYIGTCIG